MRYANVYGECCMCGATLEPVWFIEEEYEVTTSGVMYKTGRKRRAVSHLECPCCLHIEVIDDSFDGDWY